MLEKSNMIKKLISDLRNIFDELEIDFIDELELSFDNGYNSKLTGFSIEEIDFSIFEKLSKEYEIDIIGVIYNFNQAFTSTFEFYCESENIKEEDDDDLLKEEIYLEDYLLKEL